MKLLLTALLAILCLGAQPAPFEFPNHDRPILDAHNCYPYEGRYSDRIDRALKTGFRVAIEQDLAWAMDPRTGQGRPVVSHTPKTTGVEPALRDYFFERVRPIIERALAEDRRTEWPLIILHFDFKALDPPLLKSVWNLLGEYQSWISTAPQTADEHQLAPLDVKPLLVLTEDADAQEQVFFRDLPAGTRLRLFGSAHTRNIQGQTRQERAHMAATLPPEQLLTERPTNYRRWWNNSWFEVEEGGQAEAGAWTSADARRLRALVDHAHRLGYWIRFYTLDGFPAAQDQGWGNGYNFGSREAVVARWKAALDAGVNLIATDQYEDLARLMH